MFCDRYWESENAKNIFTFGPVNWRFFPIFSYVHPSGFQEHFREFAKTYNFVDFMIFNCIQSEYHINHQYITLKGPIGALRVLKTNYMLITVQSQGRFQVLRYRWITTLKTLSQETTLQGCLLEPQNIFFNSRLIIITNIITCKCVCGTLKKILGRLRNFVC